MAALVICITIHEFAHAYSALRAGDDTAKLKGRVSLNPLDHLDPIGHDHDGRLPRSRDSVSAGASRCR